GPTVSVDGCFVPFEGLIDVVSGAKNMKHFYIFWLNVFVFGGQSVVDKTTVAEGQTFTITCDHLHVKGTMPNCFLDFLEVRRYLPESFNVILSFSDGHTNRLPKHWTGLCINPG
ncbi:unnamed protein product, partial [Lymnaea stagnalis]